MEGQHRLPVTRHYPLAAEGATGRARRLRRNAPLAEQLLWRQLRASQLGGYAFRRQYPLGPYVVDFFCFQQKLAIELDGGQHAQQGDRDAKRAAWLKAQGVRVLRFWNNQVTKDIDAVKQAILLALETAAQASPERPSGGDPRPGKDPLSSSLPWGERTSFAAAPVTPPSGPATRHEPQRSGS